MIDAARGATRQWPAAAGNRPTLAGFLRSAAIALAMLTAQFAPPLPAQNDTSGQAVPPDLLNTLAPGARGYVVEILPVNVVFVGYEPGDGPLQVDVQRFLAGQSSQAVGVTMMPLFRGLIQPSYTVALIDLRLHFADAAFEDALFGRLREIGELRAPTEYQQRYNDDPNSARTIDHTLNIDAPSVETWLAERAGDLGVDPSEPTVFFINWFGRDDFAYHVYRKTDEPPTDSNTDFGSFDENALIAWGGTPANPPRRVWFHDLSAGPDDITKNWNLTDADVEGDGFTDYRLPPVWEYATPSDETYRRFDDLTGDLSKVLRYVAIDLLFASSPLYPPALTEALMPESVSVDVTRVVHPNRPNAPLDPGVVIDRLSSVRPWQSYNVTQAVRDYSDRIVDIQECWIRGHTDPVSQDTSCYGDRAGGYGFFDMYLHLRDQRFQYVDGHSDHAIPALVFPQTDEGLTTPFIAVAESDPYIGIQSHVVTFWTPEMAEIGYGHTDTVVHELGHYLGLSHPHDGIDTELDPATGITRVRIFRAVGNFHFVWVGGASSTVMHYERLTTRFSQFDLDRMGRWVTAAYLNQSNHVLGQLLGSPQLDQVLDDVATADQLATISLWLYRNRAYRTAGWYAKAAADMLTGAAVELGVPIEPQAGPAQVKAPTPQPFFVSPSGPAGSEYHVPPGPAAYQTQVRLPDLEAAATDGGAVPAAPLSEPVELQPAPGH